MDCVFCGAELRPNARYCNRCGAEQPVSASIPSTLSSLSSASSTVPVGTNVTDIDPTSKASFDGPEENDSYGRMKRPPRVLRAEYESQDQSSGQDGATASSQAIDDMAGRDLFARPDDLVSIESHEMSSTGLTFAGGAKPADEEETEPFPTIRASRPVEPETIQSMAWTDTETAETEILPVRLATTGKLDRIDNFEAVNSADASVQSEMPQLEYTTSAASTPATAEGSAQSGMLAPDALSWPLPVSIIIGGRYRVETVVNAEPDDQDGENVYRVSDLRGYERCWSCLQEYGEGTEASDRFCRECGADMLGREYLMYERRIPADGLEIAIDQAKTSPEHPAVTGILVTQEERTFTQSSRSYRVIPRLTEPSPFPHGAHILIGVATDVGKTRAGERNEDSVGALVLNLAHDSHTQPLALGIVADGLGGHVNGQDASRLATRMVTEYILRKVALPLVSLPVDGVAIEEDLKSVLLEGVRAANAALCNANDETGADMGSTLVSALLFGSSAYIVNVGDSRGYLFSDGNLRQITTDHSFVEQLIISGFITPADRYTHPQRNQILRSLGDELNVEIDVFEQKLKPGMRLMLCSDGLWEMVRDDESARILRETTSPQEACDRLIASANDHGGEDNISVVVIEVCG
ncbi:MAG: protein phosphatase 2C domain-containing protein [Ktedonobacterales bacterium]